MKKPKKQRINEKYSGIENNREFDIHKRAGSQSDILIRLAVIYINYWNYYKRDCRKGQISRPTINLSAA